MKFLEDEKLFQITQELSDVLCGTRIINGRIEAFSCKRAGTEKKIAHTLAEKFNNEFESSPSELWKHQNVGSSSSSARDKIKPNSETTNKTYHDAQSPLGDFQEMGTRRLLTDLILTLNASFPDYDFSAVKPDHFQHLEIPATAVLVNEKLSEIATRKDFNFLNNLWKVIDEVIVLSECDVFSYTPPDSIDDMFVASLNDGEEATYSTDALWSFNYFFFNRSLKRIVFFTCVQTYLTPGNDQDFDDVLVPDTTTGDSFYEYPYVDMEQDTLPITPT